MQIESLAAIHIAKRKSAPEALAQGQELARSLNGAFCLESCQRWLWVTTTQELDRTATAGLLANRHPSIDVFREKDAYDFLLRVATGLESEVVGETDIFGQLKEAWKGFLATNTALVCELSPWFQRLFEDTKEIRSQYLHDLGGASYGSLVRKVLHQVLDERAAAEALESRPELVLARSLRSGKPKVLIVGAGQIAQSIAPWLLEYDLLLWNRSPEKLERLTEELTSRGSKTSYRLIIGEDEERKAWMEATHVVLCIPIDPACDDQRIQWWKDGLKHGYSKGHIIHLGGLREQCRSWQVGAQFMGAAGFHALDDLFQLKDEQDAVRSRSIRLARLACEERAKLRVLGGLSIPHGWEDLMGFASERELALSWSY